ncbi:MAG: N-acetyltransferase family protein [Sphingomonadales bacterium]
MAGAAVTIRPAESDDISAIAQIYNYYVCKTVISFETEPPDEAEMRRRWRSLTADGYPYLVVQRNGAICGFAFAGPYKPRKAYAGTVEESIYLIPEARGTGLGTELMGELILAAEKAGYRQMVSGIADDLSAASLALHRKFGFRQIGRLEKVGRKFGRLIDIMLVQRQLGDGN